MTKKISYEFLMKTLNLCILIPICTVIMAVGVGMVFGIAPEVIITLIPKPIIGIWMLVSVILVMVMLLKGLMEI